MSGKVRGRQLVAPIWVLDVTCPPQGSNHEKGKKMVGRPSPIGLVAAGSIHLRLRATDYGQSSGVILPGEARTGVLASSPGRKLPLDEPWPGTLPPLGASEGRGSAISMRMEDVCGLAAEDASCPASSQEALAISEAHIPGPVCIHNSFPTKCLSNAFLADNNPSCQLLRKCKSHGGQGDWA